MRNTYSFANIEIRNLHKISDNLVYNMSGRRIEHVFPKFGI